MALFCTAIRRDSVFLLKFSHVRFRLFALEYSCFSSYFCFLAIFVPLILVFSVLFLVTVISLFPRFFRQSSCHCIDASTLFSMLVSPLPPSFLETYSLSTSSLVSKVLCIVMSCLDLWSICWSSFLVRFKNGPEYLTRGKTHVFIPLMIFMRCSLVSTSFSFSYYYFYFYFTPLRVFHISVSRWSFIGVWVTASHLKSSGPFSVFICTFSNFRFIFAFLQPSRESLTKT